MISEVPKSFEQPEENTDALVQAYYDGLGPEVRARYGLGLVDVIKARMDSYEDYAQAMAIMKVGGLPDRGLPIEQACNAVLAFMGRGDQFEPTGYPAIDKFCTARQDVLSLAHDDPNESI